MMKPFSYERLSADLLVGAWKVNDGGRLKEDSRPRPERFNHQPSTASHERSRSQESSRFYG